MNMIRKDLSTEGFIEILKNRFVQHPERHPDLVWDDILAKLKGESGKLWSLSEMEKTGGEPDCTGYDPVLKEYLYMDSGGAPESLL
jgi:hypothetical protein